MGHEVSSEYQLVMPRLGLTMTEAIIVAWLKAEGEWVEKGTPLFVIENEKSTVEIEAAADGYLHILTPVDVVVPVLAPVGLLSGGGTVSDHHAARMGEDMLEDDLHELSPLSPQSPFATTVSGVRASPKARALARKLSVSLDGLTGSGIRGMIVIADVQRRAAIPAVNASPLAQRLAAEAGLDLSTIAGSGLQGRIMRRDVEQAIRVADGAEPRPAPAMHGASAAVSAEESVLPLSGLRAIIASRLSQGWRERPQVTLTTEADATNLVAARQQLNAELAAQGEKISYNALLIKLAAQVLKEQPNINVQLSENGLQVMPNINIGLAVDTERGLLVPVVHDVIHKSLRQVNQELNALSERALQGRSLPDDLSGGTFTITNLGAYDIDAFTPIINPPECAILGLGRIRAKPVGLDGQVVLREMVALSLSFDHRLVDGAPAGRFLQRIKQLVERPFALTILTG